MPFLSYNASLLGVQRLQKFTENILSAIQMFLLASCTYTPFPRDNVKLLAIKH